MNESAADAKALPIRYAVGAMTGTSIDGIDAALVRIEGVGLTMTATLIHHIARPLGDLRNPLREAASQKPLSAGAFAQLAWALGEFYADVIDTLIRTSNCADLAHTLNANGSSGLALICVHGQTVFHQPPYSWQLINPALLVQRFGCPVVFDLRQADLAAGGQGAPITPIADWVLFRNPQACRAIVNLGGFCNITVLPASRVATEKHTNASQQAGQSPCQHAPLLDAIRGYDVCACNQILDAVARKIMGAAFDEDGRTASSGNAQPHATDELYLILSQQRESGRSLGTGDEAIAWVDAHRDSLSPADLAASAVHAIARCIAERLRQAACDEAILAGGGVRNRALLSAISSLAGVPVHLSDSLGVPAEAREAMAFAVLGALCADGIPITLPQITGCRRPAPLSGTWCNPPAAAPVL